MAKSLDDQLHDFLKVTGDVSLSQEERDAAGRKAAEIERIIGKERSGKVLTQMAETFKKTNVAAAKKSMQAAPKPSTTAQPRRYSTEREAALLDQNAGPRQPGKFVQTPETTKWAGNLVPPPSPPANAAPATDVPAEGVKPRAKTVMPDVSGDAAPEGEKMFWDKVTEAKYRDAQRPGGAPKGRIYGQLPSEAGDLKNIPPEQRHLYTTDAPKQKATPGLTEKATWDAQFKQRKPRPADAHIAGTLGAEWLTATASQRAAVLSGRATSLPETAQDPRGMDFIRKLQGVQMEGAARAAVPGRYVNPGQDLTPDEMKAEAERRTQLPQPSMPAPIPVLPPVIGTAKTDTAWNGNVIPAGAKIINTQYGSGFSTDGSEPPPSEGSGATGLFSPVPGVTLSGTMAKSLNPLLKKRTFL